MSVRFAAIFLACALWAAASTSGQPGKKKGELEARIERYFDFIEGNADELKFLLKLGKQGFPTYKRLLREQAGNPPYVGVYGVLERIPGARDEFLEQSVAHLMHKEPGVRAAAVRFIGTFATKDEMTLMVSMLYDQHPVVVYEAFQVVGEKGGIREKTAVQIWAINSPLAKYDLSKKDVKDAIEKIDKRLAKKAK